MIRIALLAFATIVFLAIAATWIDTHVLQWAAGAMAAFVASFILADPVVVKHVP